MKTRMKVPVVILETFLLIFLTLTGSCVSARASGDLLLGAAGNYQILSGAALSLGATITGLDPANVGTSTNALLDLNNAIANFSSSSATQIAADLGGNTYRPGLYVALNGTAFTITSSIVLDGLQDCNSKFVFVTAAAMNTTAGISITLINQAKASNVYWVSGAAITIGASNNISGNFLSSAAITVGASTSVDGRLLGLAAVTVGASDTFQGYPLVGCSELNGVLAISVPAALTVLDINAGESLVFQLGTVEVTDTRNTGAGWTVDAQLTSFTNSAGDQIGKELFSYSLNGLLASGGAILSAFPLDSMIQARPVLTATVPANPNGATWAPVLTILIPQDQPEGRYLGVITHSVF